MNKYFMHAEHAIGQWCSWENNCGKKAGADVAPIDYQLHIHPDFEIIVLFQKFLPIYQLTCVIIQIIFDAWQYYVIYI